MKEKLKQMGYKMQQSMIGRYGIDALYKALLVIYLILVVTGSALARVSRPVYTVLWVLSLAVLIYAIFRSFSRNIAARQRENARWLALTAPIRREGRLLRDKWTFRKPMCLRNVPVAKRCCACPARKASIPSTAPIAIRILPCMYTDKTNALPSGRAYFHYIIPKNKDPRRQNRFGSIFSA